MNHFVAPNIVQAKMYAERFHIHPHRHVGNNPIMLMTNMPNIGWVLNEEWCLPEHIQKLKDTGMHITYVSVNELQKRKKMQEGNAPPVPIYNVNILGLDVEASGQGLKTNFMTQLGGALVDPNTMEKIAGFNEYLPQPEGTTWEERCVVEFWEKNPERYEETKKGVANAKPIEEVMQRFKDWAKEVSKIKKTFIVFDTPGFDQAWIDYYLGDMSCLYLTGSYEQPIDISSYMSGAGKGAFDGSSKKDFSKAIGKEFPKWNVSHDHHPENDATVIALNACFVMKELGLHKN